MIFLWARSPANKGYPKRSRADLLNLAPQRMQREAGLERITRDARSVVTVGTFDGVHLGHQAIIRYLVERAEARGGKSTVVTFDPHPRAVVRGEDVPLLTTPDERADVMEGLGLGRFLVVPFTKDFSQMGAEAYVEDFLVKTVGLKEIVVGYDHRFGRGREGDRALLERMGEKLGFGVDVIPAQEVGADVVSSSAIRAALLDGGDVERAARMLGRPYSLAGTVARGEGRGRTIGFPTANVFPDDARKLMPKRGVYAVRAEVPGYEALLDGMANIGLRPTFGGKDLRLEVHLLDFEGELYGQRLRARFIRRLREERRFDSPEALAEQLSKDRARCRGVFQAST